LLPEEKSLLEANGRHLTISALERKTVLPVLAAIERALWREGHTLAPPSDSAATEPVG
jgi:hypothetical protein